MDTTTLDKHLDFECESNTIICGPTSSGKTQLMASILLNGVFDRPVTSVYVCAPDETIQHWEDREEMSQLNEKYTVHFVRGVDDTLGFLKQLGASSIRDSILILDDVGVAASSPAFRRELENLFYVGTHHKSMWTFLMTHNLFLPGVISLRRNTQNFILFSTTQDHNASVQYVTRLVGSAYTNIFMDCWNDATKEDHGWLRYDIRLRDTTKKIISGNGVTSATATLYHCPPSNALIF